jgi:acetyl esterase/lipase
VAALRRRLAALVVVPFVLLAACAEDDESADGSTVRSEVLSHESTQDVLLFQPEADGPWPVVMAYHGIDGTAEDMALLGEQVAATGAVVFAPTYRTDLSSEETRSTAVRDGECGYRFARSVAADHDADLEQPMTGSAGPSEPCTPWRSACASRSTPRATASRASPNRPART